MSERQNSKQPTEKDRLVTRPEDPLPTPDDPGGAHAKGFPADPKPKPKSGQADANANQVDYTV
jgi:hypothetical protein